MSHVLAPARVPALPWLDAARAAVVHLSRALGPVTVVGAGGAPGVAVAGALVPIMSELAPVQVGLFSDHQGCETLARALLQAAAGEGLSRAQIVDAMAEIANMLSGQVKARVRRYATGAALGLPAFVHGPVETQRSQVVETLEVILGAATAWIVVVHAS